MIEEGRRYRPKWKDHGVNIIKERTDYLLLMALSRATLPVCLGGWGQTSYPAVMSSSGTSQNEERKTLPTSTPENTQRSHSAEATSCKHIDKLPNLG